MNRKPDTAPRFAVNRADMLSRLPGVQLSALAKRFARGKPKLITHEPAIGSLITHDSNFPTPFRSRASR